VTVEIQAGGRSLVRVADDGTGMSRDDALLCLERHATSKIRRAEDLAGIATMGFRGEALPSIASVSRFTLTTRERDSQSPEGTQVVISGGKMLEVRAAGSAPGTTVDVRQLFFNLPARRKFLRTEPTESAHIQHYLTLAGLAFPEVAFTFQKDGRLIWQLPAIKSGSDVPARLAALRERLRALYGGEQALLPVDFSAAIRSSEPPGEEPGPDPGPQTSNLRLWGFIGAPGVSRLTREDQHLFVNRRPVQNPGLNFALFEGYHTALMKGRYPVCCLFLEIDPAAVDVNIHPAKREVRFHQEGEVRRLVAQAVRETLLRLAPGPQSTVHSPQSAVHSPQSDKRSPQSAAHPSPATPQPEGPKEQGGNVEQAEQASSLLPRSGPQSEGQDEQGVAGGREVGKMGQASLPSFPAGLRPASDAAAAQAGTQPVLRMGFGPQQPTPPPPETPPPQLTSAAAAPSARVTPAAAVPLLNVPLRLLGVVGRLYVVLESDRGLVLLDQHAAHERILYEQMLNRLERNDQAPSQRLLLPETVELSARDSSFVREQLPALGRLGVGLSEFGERTFLLDALPPFVKGADPRRFVLAILDELKASGQEVNTLRLAEQTVAKTVCRHAVKARDPLAGPELEALVEDLRHCAMPYTCPHGRPTLIEMNFRELEKKFGRTA